jgi:mannose/fructose/N-acetylgalactosamine-specific phosphotransferase system component IIB
VTVAHMRIDNRLIHGQVTVKWVGAVGADHLIVTNDDVAKDEIQRMILPQAARGVKTSILGIDDTLRYCEGPAAANEKIMLIAKLPSDALRLLQGGLKPQEINVGNQAPVPGTKFTMVTRSIAVTADDARLYREIAGLGTPLTSKMMPTDKPTDFLGLLAAKKL